MFFYSSSLLLRFNRICLARYFMSHCTGVEEEVNPNIQEIPVFSTLSSYICNCIKMSSLGCCPVCYRRTDNSLNLIGGDAHDPVNVRAMQKRFFKFLERYLITGWTTGLGEKFDIGDKRMKRFPFSLEQFSEIGMVSCRDCLIIMETFCQLYHQLKTTELLLDWHLQKLKGIMVGSQRVPARMKYFCEFIGNLSEKARDCRWEDVEEMMSCIVKSKKLLIAKCSENTSNSYPKLEMTKCGIATRAQHYAQIQSQDVLKSTTTHVDEQIEVDTSNSMISNIAYEESSPASACTPEPIKENEVMCTIDESTGEQEIDLSTDDNVHLSSTGEANATHANPQETQHPLPELTTFGTFAEPDEEFSNEGGSNIIGSDNLHSLAQASNNEEMDVDLDGGTVVSAELQIPKTEINETPYPDLDTVPSSSQIVINIPEVPNPTLHQERRSSLRAKYRCEHCAKTFPLLGRLQRHLQECQNQDNSDQDEDDTTSAIYPNMDNDDSDNISLSSSSSEEEDKLRPKFADSDTGNCASHSLVVEPPYALDITKCQKQPSPEHFKLSLKCPDCGDLHQTFKSFLVHRKDSESCKALYDPTASVKVEVVRPALEKQNNMEESKPAFVQFAIIELSQGIFICDDCGLALYSPVDMEKHKELHGSFPCKFCQLRFTYAPELALHELQHSSCCPRCEVRYTGKQIMSSYLRHHLKVHLSLALNEPSCAICKTTAKYLGPSGLAEHIKSHHDLTSNSTPERCTVSDCGAYYLNNDQLQQHLKVCHAQVQERDKRGGRKCKDCGRSFYLIMNLRRHRLKYHAPQSSSDNFIECPQAKCPRVFKCKSDLDIHTKKMHSSRNKDELMKLKCPDCNLLFIDIKGLLLHRKDAKECVPPQDPSAIIRVEVVTTPRNENSLDELSKRKIFAVVDLPQEIYICETCGVETFSIEDNQAHKSLHGSFKCNFCHTKRKYAPGIAKHEREHVDPKKHGVPNGIKCPQCDLKWRESSTGSKTYVHHYLKAHMSLTFNETKCAICKTGAINHVPFQLAQHLKRFHDMTNASSNNVKRCTVTNCNAYFLTKMQHRSHLKMRHEIDLEEDKRKYKCKDCGKCYFQPQPLRAHRLKHHVSSEEVLPCVFSNCYVVFESKEDLISHIMAGTSLNYHKPLDHSQSIKCVQCPICDALFNESDPRFLVEHMQSNHGEEKATHVCEFCGKIFKLKDRLERHYLSHSGPESWEFECSVCSRKCINKQKLNEHMRTHTKDKPFVCQVCGQAYAHRHNLRIHVNNKHKDQVQDIPRKFTKTSNLSSRKGIKRKNMEVKSNEESASESDR